MLCRREEGDHEDDTLALLSQVRQRFDAAGVPIQDVLVSGGQRRSVKARRGEGRHPVCRGVSSRQPPPEPPHTSAASRQPTLPNRCCAPGRYLFIFISISISFVRQIRFRNLSVTGAAAVKAEPGAPKRDRLTGTIKVRGGRPSAQRRQGCPCACSPARALHVPAAASARRACGLAHHPYRPPACQPRACILALRPCAPCSA